MKKFNLPLVNAHTHSAMIDFRWKAEDLCLEKWLQEYIWPMEAKYVNEQFVYENTKLAIIEMKNKWIRLINDMYWYQDYAAKAAQELGMNYILWLPIINFPAPWVKSWEEWLQETERLIIKYQNDELIKVAVAPHSIYATSEELLIKAKQLSEKYQTIFHIHIAESKQEFDDSMKNNWCSPIKYLHNLWILNNRCILAHCVWLTDEDIDIIAQSWASVAHCPLSNLKLWSGVAPIAKLLDKWVNICLWTDSAASSNRLDIWEAGKIAWLLQKWITNNPEVLPTKQIIKMMTINWMKALWFRELDGKSIEEIESVIDNEENYNYLYELNAEEIF